MAQSEEAIKNCLLATAGYDNQIKLWRVDNGSCHRSIPHPDSVTHKVAWYCLWLPLIFHSTALCRPLLTAIHPSVSIQQVNVLAITSDRLSIAAGGHSKIRLFDTQDGNNSVSCCLLSNRYRHCLLACGMAGPRH